MQDKIHYLVDGYNLLFRSSILANKKSLEEARYTLMHNLDAAAEALSLSITVVFDAPLQSDDLRRSHFYALEIIFTAKGQTADDCIVAYVERKNEKQEIVVVTSDKRLGARVKHPKVTVVGVKDFMKCLSKKRLKKKPPLPQVKQTAKPQKPATIFTYDPKNLPLLTDIDVWEKIFLGGIIPNNKNER